MQISQARVTEMREKQAGEGWRDNGKVRLQPLLNPSLRHGKMQSLLSASSAFSTQLNVGGEGKEDEESSWPMGWKALMWDPSHSSLVPS